MFSILRFWRTKTKTVKLAENKKKTPRFGETGGYMYRMKTKAVVSNHGKTNTMSKLRKFLPGIFGFLLLFFVSSITAYAAGPVTDHFSGSTIQPFWTVKKPKGWVYQSGGRLVIKAPVNTYMRNLYDTAPRVQQPIDDSKDWIVEVNMDHNPCCYDRGAGIYLALSGNRLWKIAEKQWTYARRMKLFTWGTSYHNTWGPQARYRIRKRGNRIYLWVRMEGGEGSYTYYGSRTYSGQITHLGLYAYRPNRELQKKGHSVATFSYVRVYYPPFKLRSDDFNTTSTKWFWMFQAFHPYGWSHNFNYSNVTRLQADGQKGSSKPRLCQAVSPNQDWTVTTRLIVRQFQGSYAAGGIFLYKNGGTFWNVASRYRSSGSHRIWGLGKGAAYSSSIAYLRVKKDGSRFTAYWSSNGTDWVEGGTSTYTGPITHVGVYASVSSGWHTVKVDYDYFNAETPPDDDVPPVSSHAIEPAPNTLGFNKSDFKVKLSATDDTSGVAEIRYTLKKGTVTIDSGSFSGDNGEFDVTDPDSAEYTVEYYAIDNVGNIEPSKTATVKNDRAAPTAAHTVIGTSTGNPDEYDCGATVNILGTDDYSGVKEINYSVNDVWSAGPASGVDIPLTGMGTYTIRYYAVDNAGNIGEETVTTITIVDITPPTSTLTTTPAAPGGSDGWYKGPDFKINISAADFCSGVDKIYYKKDTDAAFTEYTVPVNPGDGEYVIEYYAVDKAGNIEEVKSTGLLKVDITAPTGLGHQFTPERADLIFIETVDIDFFVDTDLTSGNLEMRYSLDGGALIPKPVESFTITVDTVGVHTIEYFAEDKAGNIASASVTFEIVDRSGAVTIIKDKITALPPSAFTNPNRQRILLDRLDEIFAKIEAGDFRAALSQLNNIKRQMDGCLKDGEPDNNDWIVDCTAQYELHDLMTYLQTLLT